MSVYTYPHPEELNGFIQEYNIGKLNSYDAILEGTENSNFIIKTSKGIFILTLYEKRVMENDLPFFLGLMSHASSNGLKCPQPLPRNDGKIYGSLSGCPASIFSYIEGNSLYDPSPKQCEEVGCMLSLMHQKTKNFKPHRKNSLSLPDWKILWGKCRPSNIDKDYKKEIDFELSFLEEVWPKKLLKGIIHADLFPDNVRFYKNHIIGLIDFYFACNDFLAYDLSICINAWCFEKDYSYNAIKANSLLKGYNTIREISKDEMQSLPILLRGAALCFFLMRLHDSQNIQYGPLTTKKDPAEYLCKFRFHKTISSISQYGF
ncbi:homoserine kinase [Candidatus Liberibacter sp.]|uniref:homoserine kinase n=1 Tax=Candidatus Liberibacter sp. TaxID=34022 RepID=UPI0015F47050|nr:homoserine kinase [Candidatus Liberibacter sp.]MBA5724265.1 homoserine kinase [Candidatus Liberibacter sp.]